MTAYGDLTGLKAHWAALGYDIGSLSDTELDELRMAASEFVDGFGFRKTPSGATIILFSGKPTGGRDQVRQWPRTGASDTFGDAYETDETPPAIIRATYEAAYFAAQNANGLNKAFKADQIVQSRKVGPLARSFFEPKSENGMPPTRPKIPAVEAQMALVTSGGDNAFGITGIVA